MGKLQQRLVNAGYRSSEALPIFFGIRVGLALVLFALFATPILMTPNFVDGARRLRRRLRPAGHGARPASPRSASTGSASALPDALDLLVVSVEAGLGLDQAIQRVGDELAFAHPDLSDELRLINLELRAGKARSEALHNLARPHRRRRRGVAGRDAGADRQVRHQRRAVAARPLATRCAPSGGSAPRKRRRRPA